MQHIDYPFSFDASGRTASTSWCDHKRDLCLQYTCTHPSERVNRPDFGAGLPRICFEGNSEQLSEVIQFVAKAGLERWLGSVIEVIELTATAEDATLTIVLKYRVRGEDEVREAVRQIPGGAF